jgi:peroxiredoxin family protein
MISMPFDAARVSGSLRALASGTEVTITFTFAAIAAFTPATCLETSLFA